MLLRDKSLLLAGGTSACCLFLLFTSCSSWRTFAANSSLFDFSLLANSLRRASKQCLHYTEMRSRILSTQQEREREKNNAHTVLHGVGVGVEDTYVEEERRKKERRREERNGGRRTGEGERVGKEMKGEERKGWHGKGRKR